MVWTLHVRLFCSSWLFNTDPHAWLHVRHVQSSTCILCRLKLLLLQTLDAGISEFIDKTINTQSLFTAPLWPFTVKDGVCRRWDVSQPAKKPPSSPKVLDLSSRKNGWKNCHDIVLLEPSTARINEAKSSTVEMWPHANEEWAPRIMNRGQLCETFLD